MLADAGRMSLRQARRCSSSRSGTCFKMLSSKTRLPASIAYGRRVGWAHAVTAPACTKARSASSNFPSAPLRVQRRITASTTSSDTTTRNPARPLAEQFPVPAPPPPPLRRRPPPPPVDALGARRAASVLTDSACKSSRYSLTASTHLSPFASELIWLRIAPSLLLPSCTACASLVRGPSMATASPAAPSRSCTRPSPAIVIHASTSTGRMAAEG
mmetsp:Transcript_9917/g.15702  ORF Transcript_9917/g.15702 Transcript_9917/m.15702 type:complete len:215 (-) Transcript_9917:276-920(-)